MCVREERRKEPEVVEEKGHIVSSVSIWLLVCSHHCFSSEDRGGGVKKDREREWRERERGGRNETHREREK